MRHDLMFPEEREFPTKNRLPQLRRQGGAGAVGRQKKKRFAVSIRGGEKTALQAGRGGLLPSQEKRFPKLRPGEKKNCRPPS